MTIYTGSGVAIVTPFFEDGSVDYETFGELIEFQISEGTDAIIVAGTTGESSTMPDDEQVAVIKFAIDRVAGRVPVIAGSGVNDTAHSIRLSQEIEKLGTGSLRLAVVEGDTERGSFMSGQVAAMVNDEKTTKEILAIN